MGFLLLSLFLCAVSSSFAVGTHEGNEFLTSTPYKIAPNVNPITGDCIEEETDLVVAGAHPLALRRFYISTSPWDPRYGNWRYNPSHYLVANLENGSYPTFAAVGDADGSICPFDRSESNHAVYDFKDPQKLAQLSPSGRHHPLNTTISYTKNFGSQNEFQYQGTIKDGSGRVRHFTSPMYCWTSPKEFKTKTHIIKIYPSKWTPYQLHVEEEILPNGNRLCYTYDKWEQKIVYPRPPLLKSITAYNADKTKILASLSFKYSKNEKEYVVGLEVVGSDERKIFAQHEVNPPFALVSAQRPGQPNVYYAYAALSTRMTHLARAEGKMITTEYNKDNKVSAQYAPVGPNGEMCPIGRYTYQDKATVVLDAEGNQTTYRYDENKRITSLELYQGNTPYRFERFTWDDKTGNIKKKVVENSSGKAILITEFEYDKNHNPILEKIGDGTEWHIIERTFSNDGFNSKLTEKEGNKKILYDYLPSTNLLISELVCDGELIRKRTFHFYDDCAICIKTITDDGATKDPNNLEGVTYRKIVTIRPRQKKSCFGLPEEVEEKTIDSYGNELLLHKVVYDYTPCGKVLKEDHYDADNTYRYSITNTYKDELLVSRTDALSHVTTFTYDPSHNLTSICKEGTHKEITYDRANRPTRILDCQTDGNHLSIHKKYDKLGRVTEESDACGKKTHFIYDSLGRIASIHYPDGAIETKEYDLLGNVIKATDGEGHVTCTTYNFRGKPLSRSYPDGKEEYFTYNPSGTVATHRDSNGAITHHYYDLFDNPIKTEIFSSSGELLKVTTATFTPFTKLSETDGEGTTTSYTYDYAGRKIAEQIATKQIFYFYDALGRLEKTDYLDYQVIEEFDLACQPIAKRIEANGECQFLERYAYDPSGNCTHRITHHGTFETTYNSFGKPLLEKDPLGFSTTHTYTFNNERIETTTDANQLKTEIKYDSRGREKEILKKDREERVIAREISHYDLSGHLIQKDQICFDVFKPIKTITHRWFYNEKGLLERFLEAEERETKYHYDSKGRLIQKIKPSGTTLNYEWDDLGRLSRYFSNDFDYYYNYDSLDRPVAIWDDKIKVKTRRDFDPFGNQIQEVLANGLKITSLYDEQGRRERLIFPDKTHVDYHYKGAYLYAIQRKNKVYVYSQRDLQGELTEVTLPVDLGTLTIQRDPLSRYKTLDSPFYKISNTQYDRVGNLLSYQYEDALGQITCDYAYDDLNQLISENEHTYAFDSLNNRLKKDTIEHQINTLCQLISDGFKTYEYDFDGNLISDGDWRYFYDTQDRLIACESDGRRIEFTYDPFHRRLSKKVFSNSKQLYEDYYIWDGENEIGTTNQNKVIEELRILGEGLGAEIGSAVLYELLGRCYIPIHDHRGCVVSHINTLTQKPAETIRYTAFGEEHTTTDWEMRSPWRFSSKRLDPETSLLYFGRRYYIPSLGRWLTQDPEGYSDGPNLYAYVSNRPLTHFDPYGLYGFTNLWDDTKTFAYGAGSYMYDIGCGLGYGLGQMGQWMYADFQYEHFNDRSFFHEKSLTATHEWGLLGQAVCNDPLGVFVPGIMEAWRNPTSLEAWGKATIDIGLIAFSTAKIVESMGTAGRFGRMGNEFSTLTKTADIAGEAFKIDLLSQSTSTMKPLGLGSTGRTVANSLKEQMIMKEIMTNPNAGTIIMKKLNDPRWEGWSKMTWYNEGVEIHYVGKWENGILKYVDDFKFVDRGI